MEPVSIEFIMAGDLKKGIEEVRKGVAGLDKDVEQTYKTIQDSPVKGIADMSARIREQREIVKLVEKDLKDLQDKLSKAAPGLAQQTLSKEAEAASRALEEEKAALNELELATKQTGSSQKALETRIRMLRDEMAELQLQGKKNSDRYRELAIEAGKLTDAYKDSSVQAKILAHDYQGLQAALSGVSGLAGAFSAAQGAMGLFAKESDDLQKIQTRVQSIMAVTIGLQQVANTLNKDSAFRVVAVAKAKQAWSKAVSYLNTQLGINIGLSKAMVATGIGAIIAAVGLLVSAYKKWQERQEKVNELHRKFQEASKTAIANAAKEQTSIETLLNVARNYNASLETRRQAVERLNAIMPDLNASLSKEGKLILKNAAAIETYITALVKAEKAKELIRLREAQKSLQEQKKAALEAAKEVERTIKSNVKPIDLGDSPFIIVEPMLGHNPAIDWATRKASQNVNELQKEVNELGSEIKKLDDQIADLLSDGSVFALLFGEPKTTVTDEPIRDFAKQLEDTKRLYQQYFAWVNAGMPDADDVFAELLKGGESFIVYLERQKQRLEGLTVLTDEEAEALRAIKDAFASEKQDGTVLDQFALDLERMKNESPSLLEYMDKLKEKRKELSGDRSEMGTRKISIVDTEARKTEQELERQTKQALDNYMAFAEKRKEVDEKYAAERELMARELEKATTDAEKKAIEAKIKLNEEANAAAIAAINDEELKQSEAYKRLHNEAKEYTRKELKMRIDMLRQILKLNTDISEELRKQLENLLEQAETALEEQETGVERAVKDMIKVADGLAAISNELRGTNDALAYTLDNLVKMIDGAAKIGEGIAKIATKDPGQIAEGIGKVVEGIAKIAAINKLTKQLNREARKEIEEFYAEAERGELRYQALLRERERQTAAMGKTSYQAIVAELEAIKSQSGQVQEAYDKVFAALQGQEYVAGQGYKHGTWFRKAKTWDVMAALAGSDYDRMEQLYERGELSETAAKDFEALRELREELEAAGIDVQELQDQLNEMLTGTTVGGLSDGLVQLFQNGKRAAQDFADSFEEIMKTAIVNTFKYKYIEEQMQPFYDSLAEAMSDGVVTEEEMAALQNQYIAIGEFLAAGWENLERITGIDLAQQQQKAMSGGIGRQLTEDTGREIVGLYHGMRLNVAALKDTADRQLDILGKGLMHLARIEQNTEYCRRLESIDARLGRLETDGIKVR